MPAYFLHLNSGSCNKSCGIIIGAVVSGGEVLVIAIIVGCYLGIKLYSRRQRSHDALSAAADQVQMTRVKDKLGMHLVTHPDIIEMNDRDIFKVVQKHIPELEESDARHVLNLVAAIRLWVSEMDKLDV